MQQHPASFQDLNEQFWIGLAHCTGKVFNISAKYVVGIWLDTDTKVSLSSALLTSFSICSFRCHFKHSASTWLIRFMTTHLRKGARLDALAGGQAHQV